MGIESLLQQNLQNAGLAGSDRLARNAMFPQSQMDKTQYATPSQMPTSAETIRSDYDAPTNAYTGLPQQRFASGGIAALRYAEGGEVDPNAWQQISYVGNPANPEESTRNYYIDPTTGNVYDSKPTQGGIDSDGIMTAASTPNLVATGEAYKNADIQGLNIDPAKAQELYDLKQKDPSQYAGQMIGQLGDLMKTQYNTNANYDQTWKQFAGLKNLNPQEWEKANLDWLGHHQGWQIGQNTSERNAGEMPAIENAMKEARAAGLSEDEIQQILGNSSQRANYQNQVRIANEMSQGSPGVFTGAIPVLGLAALTALTAGAGAGAAGTLGAGTAGAAGAGATAASTMPAWLAAAGKGAAIGAAMGGGSAALQGGDIGKGALYGGLTGAVGGGIGNAMGGGYMGNMAGGAMAGGTGAALRGGNVLEGAGYGAAGGALSSGISSLDAPAELKTGLNMFGKPLAMSQLRSAIGGGQPSQGSMGIPGATPSGGITANTPGVFNFAPNVQPAMGLGISNPVVSPYTPPTQPLFLSKLSEFKYDAPTEMAAGGMAQGGGIGDLGSYSDGGRLLKGPGDGMSDHIPATIGAKQPARLAEGEFVIPADVVSHLGNGSTDAGAKQLYKMMDNIRKARTGNPKQGKQINPDKFTPKG